MAADWIPVRKGLKDELEVMRIATLTGLSRRVVVSVLIDFWSWCDSVTEDGILKGVTVDEMSDICPDIVRGFWDALARVGWIVLSDDGAMIPNYDRWLGCNAKKRLKDAMRKRDNRYVGGMSAFRPQNVPRKRGQNADKTRTTEQNRTVNEKPNLKGRVRRDWTIPEDAGFARFWEAYPRKCHRHVSWKAWQALAPDEALQSLILASLDPQRWPARWREDEGRWIPSPAKWLRDRRWEQTPIAGPAGDTPQDRAARTLRQRQQAEEDRRRAEAERERVRAKLEAQRRKQDSPGGSPDGPKGSDGQPAKPDAS